jgi:Tir chaperone protein (CesT) family
MTPHNLVEELGRRLNTPLALDKARLARIIVDGSLPVDFELDEPNGRLLIYSVIGILPAGRAREQFFERLLAANLFGAETGPCSPAFDRERNEMLLWFSVGEDGNIEEVIVALENLVGRCEHWRAELAQAQTVDSELEPEPIESSGFESFVRA